MALQNSSSHAGELKGHVINHCPLDELLGQVAPDTREGGLAVPTCSKASGSGEEARDETGVNVVIQSVLSDVSSAI